MTNFIAVKEINLHSTMQRLKRFSAHKHKKGLISFTFHYAKIKTGMISNGRISTQRFTFHYAKIKTIASGVYDMPSCDLHSTMQRLKQSSASIACFHSCIYIPLCKD